MIGMTAVAEYMHRWLLNSAQSVGDQLLASQEPASATSFNHLCGVLYTLVASKLHGHPVLVSLARDVDRGLDLPSTWIIQNMVQALENVAEEDNEFILKIEALLIQIQTASGNERSLTTDMSGIRSIDIRADTGSIAAGLIQGGAWIENPTPPDPPEAQTGAAAVPAETSREAEFRASYGSVAAQWINQVSIVQAAASYPNAGNLHEKGAPKDRLWNIPTPVRSFTNRELEISDLVNRLDSDNGEARVRIFALHGIGGVGKTQLARAYAHRNFRRYKLGWWILADTIATTEAMLADLAVRLGAQPDLPSNQLTAQLQIILAEEQDWLLVFDNSGDPKDLEPFLPNTGLGHVLITSRNKAWGGIAEPMEIDVLPMESAVELLVIRTQDSDLESARALASELGRLSLAIEQAAAYCGEYQLSLAAYLELFRSHHAELLTLGRPLGYRGSVDTVFGLALEQLRESKPAVLQALQICALFAPDQIPLHNILKYSHVFSEPLRSAASNPVRRNEIIGTLYRNSLLVPDAENTVRIHRLLREVTINHMSDEEQDALLVSAVDALAEQFPNASGDLSNRSTCAMLVNHANNLIARAEQLNLSRLTYASLLDHVGYYLLVWTTDMNRARVLQEKALAIRHHLNPDGDLQTAISINGLATTMRHMGLLKESRTLHEHALALHQRTNPGDHADTSVTLTDLSFTCSRLGDGHAAYNYGEQALAMRRRIYRTDHMDIVISLNDLGVALRQLGEHTRALALHEEALAMALRLESGDHPETAQSYYELGVTNRRLGHSEEAFEYGELGLLMRERLHIGDHRHTARSLHDLSLTARRLGRSEHAREFCERALAMRERLHPGDHPETADSLIELAAIEQELNHVEFAEALHRRAVIMVERISARDQEEAGGNEQTD